MPNEKTQQENKEQKIVIEKWQPNELPGRAEAREREIRSQENTWKTRREQEIAEKYSRESRKAEINRQLQKMEADAAKKISENLTKLLNDWEKGDKQELQKKEQDAIERLETEKQKALEKAKKSWIRNTYPKSKKRRSFWNS